MKCEDIQKLLSRIVDDESSYESSEELLNHLRGCDACNQFYERAQQINQALSSARIVLPNSALANVVKERIAQKREGKIGQSSFVFWKRAPVYALVALLAVGVGNLAGHSLTQAFLNSGEEHSLELMIPDGTEYLSDIFTDMSQGEQMK